MNSRTFWLLILGALVIRVLLVLTSIGTSDVIFWILWSNVIEKHGVAGAYAVSPMLNHPPLSLWILHGVRQIANVTGVELTDLFRLVQVLADLVSVAALLVIGRRVDPANRRMLALWFFLAPVSIAVSGFHCNTDATMLMFVLAALAFFVHERDFAAGAIFALAVAIKIPALILLPFVVVAAKGKWWRIVAPFAAVTAAIWTPIVARGGTAVIRNAFGWAGMSGSWGFPAVGRQLSVRLEPLVTLYVRHGRWVVLFGLAVLGVLFLIRIRMRGAEASRREVLLVAPLCYLVLLFLAPGFGIQYVVWPLPFIPFLFGRRATFTWVAISSAFVITIYTYWSDGFPWRFADAMARRPGAEQILPLIHFMWITIGAFLIAGTWRWMRLEWSGHADTSARPLHTAPRS